MLKVKNAKLRLLINNETEKILCAEAERDFVDLLLGFLTLPAGSIIKLFSTLDRPKKVACLRNLYQSVEMLQPVFLNADKKSLLLDPRVKDYHSSDHVQTESVPGILYGCGNTYTLCRGKHNVTTQSGGICACGKSMNVQVTFLNPSKRERNELQGGAKSNNAGSGGSEEGYVKETVVFMITDQLEISPASTITSINLLNKLNVKDLTEVEERTAIVGPTEALELLRASLASTSALNDVFGPRVFNTPRRKRSFRHL